MASFWFNGTTASFDASRDGASDRSGLLEEQRFTIMVPDAANWGALFSTVTPREHISMRACKSAAGESTIIVDLGVGGVGTLDVEEFDPQAAILCDLTGEAPMTGPNGPRFAQASFLIIPGAPVISSGTGGGTGGGGGGGGTTPSALSTTVLVSVNGGRVHWGNNNLIAFSSITGL